MKHSFASKRLKITN